MAYDLTAWRQRPDSSLSPARIYSLVSEDVEIPDLEPIDAAILSDALDRSFPGWRSDDAPFTCSLHSHYLSFSVFFSKVADVVPRIARFAAASGLVLFDPQVDDIPALDARLARTRRTQELKRLQEDEVADLRRLAEAGDVKAELHLANRLATGTGARKNAREAYRWYRRAAESGNGDAAFNLASCLQYGDGVAQDLTDALYWYRRAADQDRTYATFALGEIYLGWGSVARDDAQAEAYFRQALEHGHPDAKAALDLLREPVITLELKKKRWKFWNPRA